MKYIPITEAMKRLGKSDRQVRRMVHSGKLAHDYAPDGKLLISVSDIDKAIRQSRPPQEIERLDAIERELIQLRGQVDTLSQRVEVLERSPRKTPPRPAQAQKQGLESDSLPANYVAIFDLIKEHGLTRRRQAIMKHMKPWIHEGHWKRAGHAIEKALDQKGQAEFMRRYVTQG